jgi:DNA-binding CsgD family transcriptional regulator
MRFTKGVRKPMHDSIAATLPRPTPVVPMADFDNVLADYGKGYDLETCACSAARRLGVTVTEDGIRAALLAMGATLRQPLESRRRTTEIVRLPAVAVDIHRARLVGLKDGWTAVLALAAEGLSSINIGLILRDPPLSGETVDNRLRRIYTHLRVRNKPEALVRGFHLGVLVPGAAGTVPNRDQLRQWAHMRQPYAT